MHVHPIPKSTAATLSSCQQNMHDLHRQISNMAAYVNTDAFQSHATHFPGRPTQQRSPHKSIMYLDEDHVAGEAKRKCN